MNGENVEVTQTFTYVGSVIRSSTSCELDVTRRLGRAWSAMNSLDESMSLPILVQKDEGPSVPLAGPPGPGVFL